MQTTSYSHITVLRFGWTAVVLLSTCLFPTRPALSQQPTDSVMMSAFQRFKADTIYHVRLDTRDSTIRVYLGHIPLTKCRFTVIDADDIADYRGAWWDKRRTGWQSVMSRRVWSGRPAVSDTVVRVVSEVSKVNPDLISRVMPRRFVVDMTEGFVLRVMTFEGVGEERSFAEKMKSFTQNWVPFMREPHLDIIVDEKNAQTLYYALEPGTPVVLIDE